MRPSRVGVVVLAACVACAPLGLWNAAVAATPPSPADLIAQLRQHTGGHARFGTDPRTGRVGFVASDASRPLARGAGVAPEQLARTFLGTYGRLFGVSNQASQLRRDPPRAGSRAVHLQQVVNGVPVTAGELAVDIDRGGNVLSVNGETLPGAAPSTTPTVGAAAARDAAVAATAKAHGVAAATLDATTPKLEIYDNRLLGAPGLDRALLVWHADVRGMAGDPFDDLVFVDAHTGGVALRFDQLEAAKTRHVCDRNNVVNANPACTSPYTRTEGQGPTGIADVDRAYDYAGATYDFYSSRFGRDSIDGHGLVLNNTVRFCPSASQCPYRNAFWDGSEMVFGAGFTADDVVGHELTHGVTESESHLLYYFQSGAINESMSDVFGELIDLTDGLGNDAANVRWLLGEEVPGGAIRNMQNPPQFGQPDKMTSTLYFGGNTDNGGVHTNSGVGNKAASLLVDGGTFNGRTVTGLGIPKVARIYYKLQVDLMTSGTDYGDLFNLLPQACHSSVGVNGITATDCGEVDDAVIATEMNQQPVNGAAPEAPVCNVGQAPTNLFFDNLENTGSGNWALTPATGSNRFYYPANPNPFTDAQYTTSGVQNIFGPDRPTTTDFSIARTANVAPPAGKTTYLRFNHSYDLEGGFDGGRLEYSTNSGGSWADAGSLIVNNGYPRAAAAWSGNAFTGVSHGYISSRVNLTSLAGQNVRFRFHVKTDPTVGGVGWFIDDVRVYTCAASAPPTARAGPDKNVVSNSNFTLDGSASSSPAGPPLTYLWEQISGPAAVIQSDRSAITAVKAPAGTTTLQFKLTVTDTTGQSGSDTIVVHVAPK
jgi:bacillolysin